MRTLALVAFSALSPLACKSVTDAKPALLTANIADPQDLNAFSQFGSCVGHAYPLPTSPNSDKNYFWPNSTNFSTNTSLRLLAACDGVTGQNDDDTNDPREFVQGQSIHLYCSGSSTAVRYFHINYPPGSLGQHVTAGSFIGYADLSQDGTPPAAIWQESQNFDISVVDGDDNNAEDYFAKLDATAFAAWSARGLTSLSQTYASPAGNCTTYSSQVGNPGIFVFTPSR